MVGRGGGGGGEVDEVEDEDEVTLLLLGCLAGGLGVLVLVGLVGGLVVRGRRAPAGQQDYTSVEVRSSSTSLQGEGNLREQFNVISLQVFSPPRVEELHAVLSSQLRRLLFEGLGAKKRWEGWESWWRRRRECFQIQTRDKILPLKPPKTPWLKLGKSSTLLFGSDFATENRDG